MRSDQELDLPEKAVEAWLAGGGEMGERVRAFDWETTALGAVDTWPQSLKTVVHIVLNSRYPMFVWWGPQLTTVYNDAYIPVLGARHPAALGMPGRDVWPDIWSILGPQAEIVLREGRATWNDEVLLVMERNDFIEETYFTWSYSPVADDDGTIMGVFCACTEETSKVLSRRRLKTLRDLGERALAEFRSVEQACHAAAETLAENNKDLPFALVYLLDADGKGAALSDAVGVDAGTTVLPERISINDASDVWSFGGVLTTRCSQKIENLGERAGRLPAGPWADDWTRCAVVAPLSRAGAQDSPAGFLVAGISPRLSFDDEYRGFVELVAGHVATAIANARAYEEERKRAEALVEIDRAKTAFFSNVSHEFRTPLTLMLGPLEDILSKPTGGVPSENRELLEVVQRNGLRLQRMVNTLLDFSRIEAGRIQATYEPIDLSVLTADLASNFRSACERAGLHLVIDCLPLGEPVYVDRDMWEKVVLNLLSNAFKFTFEGEIVVALRSAGDRVELVVRDTGPGIPPHEAPHVFERFRRVKGASGRTHEGTGIGLALVQELVKLHGGTIRVESVPGKGSSFIVAIPRGKSHLPADRIGASRTLASTAVGSSPFVEEALRWLPDSLHLPPSDMLQAPSFSTTLRPAAGRRARILWADDNADMRDYVRRLLSPHYDVEGVADGTAALVAARSRLPDLILADVMMPQLDGFELLRELRADPNTRTIPVILLSARAGEESRVEGLEAGADDYLVKPFGARELLARVAAHLEIANVRRQGESTTRALNDELEAALCAREEFLSIAAHELRNPVNALQLQLVALLRATQENGEGVPREWAIDRIGQAVAAVRRLVRLVETLLDVSRITAGRLDLEPEEMDFGQSVQVVIDRFKEQLKDRQITTRIVSTTGSWDRVRLEQIVTNLVSNAIKYGEGLPIEVSLESDDGTACLSVTDHGIGIEPENQSRLFEKFERAVSRRNYGGFGLGLWITRQLVDAMGGQIAVESHPGEGSTFRVKLPRHRTEEPANAR